MIVLLSFLFFLTSLIYSSVGFGGGSTYLALLLLWKIPYEIFPIVALSCNIIVVSGNCINYARAGNLNFKFLSPYLVGSIPLAYIGGSLAIEKEFFQILLFSVLLIDFRSYEEKRNTSRNIPKLLAIFIGGILGFISGVVGIGGGIFLSPILFLLRAAKPKEIITAASIFILINSVSGVAGQFTKINSLDFLLDYIYLILAVLIGGQLGNFLNLKILPTKVLALITSILVLFVSIRMGVNIFG